MGEKKSRVRWALPFVLVCCGLSLLSQFYAGKWVFSWLGINLPDQEVYQAADVMELSSVLVDTIGAALFLGMAIGGVVVMLLTPRQRDITLPHAQKDA